MSGDVNNSHLSKSLRGASFFKMPSIPYDKLFLRQSLINDCSVEDKLYRAPFVLVKRAFFTTLKNIDYIVHPGAKILFYCSDPRRKSNEINFLKAVNTIENPDVIIERYGNCHFSCIGFYLFFILLPIWSFQLFGRGLKHIEKYQILKSLLEVYRIRRFFRRVDVKKYNLLVCYHDCIFHECMLSLIFKAEKIVTATLQHGQFNAWREPTYINSGIELLSSPSNFFLCWNKYTQDEALKCGWDINSLPIVGIISNIGKGQVKCDKPSNKIFGVVLSHPSWEEENVEMIKAANLLAERIGYKYYLKLHPNYKDDYFKEIIEDSVYIGNVQKGIDIYDYTNMVEFSIVGSSSVFVEMVYFDHDILRYSSGLPSDKYSTVHIGSTFSKKEEIESCYKKLQGQSNRDLFAYLCHSYDTGRCYRNFFMRYSN